MEAGISLTPPAEWHVPHRFAELLRTALTPAGAGNGLYFSYNTNLTMSQQRYASSQLSSGQASKPAWAAADPHFFWNRHIALPLLGERIATALHALQRLQHTIHHGCTQPPCPWYGPMATWWQRSHTPPCTRPRSQQPDHPGPPRPAETQL